MSGTVTPLTRPQKWETARILVGASNPVGLERPASFKVNQQVTIMIQASNGNNGTVYVSSKNTVDNIGTDAGFELRGGEAVVLPIGDVDSSEVWVHGTDAADTINCSYFTTEIVC